MLPGAPQAAGGNSRKAAAGRQAWNDAEQRGVQAGAQGGDVFVASRHFRIDLVGDPAGERQAARGDGLGREQAMVDAAESQADDEDHRQREADGEVGAVTVDA